VHAVSHPNEVTVELPYGAGILAVQLPAAQTIVVRPAHEPAAPDPMATLLQALRQPVAGPPLRSVVPPGARVAVSICDGTRAQPREEMLRALLLELDGVVGRENFTILVATGTHRGNTESELRRMLGDELAGSLRIINHDARDAGSLAWCGVHGDGVPVLLNRHWVQADVRITTGFVEPHFFAGFSGGPKLVAPGLAGLATVLELHDAARIGSERATWAVCEGNPVHDDVRAIAAATGVDFAFDVVLNSEQRIVAAFGGEILAMHQAARDAVRRVAMRPVDQLFDIVLTSNSGSPLDQNLYQAVKGMSAAATVVKPGGLIVCAAECLDGVPDHGLFGELLQSADSAESLLETIAARTETVPDQWQVQVLARTLMRARIGLYCDGLTDEQVRRAHLIPVHDIAEAVTGELARLGSEARVCVLPEGPQTIPFVEFAEARS
jgi:nickel-dependent lactate racemase